MLNILQCIRQPPTTKIHLIWNVSSVEVEKSCCRRVWVGSFVRYEFWSFIADLWARWFLSSSIAFGFFYLKKKHKNGQRVGKCEAWKTGGKLRSFSLRKWKLELSLISHQAWIFFFFYMKGTEKLLFSFGDNRKRNGINWGEKICVRSENIFVCDDGKKLVSVEGESHKITFHGKLLMKLMYSHLSGMMRITLTLKQSPFESWQPVALVVSFPYSTG